MVETLASYPYVIVRLACTMCGRRGAYRLVRLGAKFGADIQMDALLEYLAGDCAYWRPRHPAREGCGAYFIDLVGTPKPPDLPPRLLKPRVIKGGRE